MKVKSEGALAKCSTKRKHIGCPEVSLKGIKIPVELMQCSKLQNISDKKKRLK
jgi:hypothetical protein